MGKPVARRGRKVTGLSKPAGPPQGGQLGDRQRAAPVTLGDEMNRSRSRTGLGRAGAAVLALIVGCLAIPSAASAANTLNLSLEPAIPGKGKPFQVIAAGTNDPSDQFDNRAVYVHFTQGLAPCASTEAFEDARPNSDRRVIARALDPGPFDERGMVSLSLQSYGFKSGVAAGHYRACGYLSRDTESLPVASARMEFTVGGTCATATNRETKAQAAVKAAKKAMKKAKKAVKKASSKSARKKAKKSLKAAKKQLKAAKKKLKVAQEDKAALC